MARRGGHAQDAQDLFRRANALIFDVDGTLAETEELHRQAFNEAFLQTGLGWWWDRAVYKKLLRVTGGKERIRAFDTTSPDPALLSDSDIAELHRIKTARYAELIAKGSCCLRPGAAELISAARRRGQRLAIATTTSSGGFVLARPLIWIAGSGPNVWTRYASSDRSSKTRSASAKSSSRK